MNEKRFEVDVDHLLTVWDIEKNERLEIEQIVALLNEQQNTIQKQNNEIKKLKSLLEFSNEQYGQKLLVELRFDNEWKADVSVIDNE